MQLLYYAILAPYNKVLDVYTACDPKLMPTFPQHRNLKASKTVTQAGTSSSTQENTNNSGEHSLHLPAISDLVIIFNISVILGINRSLAIYNH